MKPLILALIFALLSLDAYGAQPSYQNFDTNWFDVDGTTIRGDSNRIVSIIQENAGAANPNAVTNTQNNVTLGGTFSGGGAELTNVPGLTIDWDFEVDFTKMPTGRWNPDTWTGPRGERLRNAVGGGSYPYVQVITNLWITNDAASGGMNYLTMLPFNNLTNLPTAVYITITNPTSPGRSITYVEVIGKLETNIHIGTAQQGNILNLAMKGARLVDSSGGTSLSDSQDWIHHSFFTDSVQLSFNTNSLNAFIEAGTATGYPRWVNMKFFGTPNENDQFIRPPIFSNNGDRYFRFGFRFPNHQTCEVFYNENFWRYSTRHFTNELLTWNSTGNNAKNTNTVWLEILTANSIAITNRGYSMAVFKWHGKYEPPGIAADGEMYGRTSNTVEYATTTSNSVPVHLGFTPTLPPHAVNKAYADSISSIGSTNYVTNFFVLRIESGRTNPSGTNVSVWRGYIDDSDTFVKTNLVANGAVFKQKTNNAADYFPTDLNEEIRLKDLNNKTNFPNINVGGQGNFKTVMVTQYVNVATQYVGYLTATNVIMLSPFRIDFDHFTNAQLTTTTFITNNTTYDWDLRGKLTAVPGPSFEPAQWQLTIGVIGGAGRCYSDTNGCASPFGQDAGTGFATTSSRESAIILEANHWLGLTNVQGNSVGVHYRGYRLVTITNAP